MDYTYDPESDALYIRVRHADIDHQVESTDGVILDVSADGALVGIDVMTPSTTWDPHPILATYSLTDSEAHLLLSLAAVRFVGSADRWSLFERATAGGAPRYATAELLTA